jgi:GT2 family glycosyltransferase
MPLPIETTAARSPEISVVIVTWNCRQMLKDCLQSLRDQLPAKSGEIIVVDNASSDGTADLVRREFPEVKLFENHSNLGFAKGNNVGLQASRGKYVCLINPDVVVAGNCLSSMIDYMDRRPGIGMLGPQIIGLDGLVQRSCMREPTLWNQFCRALALDTLVKRSHLFGGYLMHDFSHSETRDVEIINGCFWMVRQEALQQVGLLDSNFWMYGEDLDWCRRFRTAGWRVVFFPAAQAVHCGGGSSRNAPLSCYIQMQRSDLRYWRKYHGLLSTFCYLALLYCHHLSRSVALGFLYIARRSHRIQIVSRIKSHFACLRWLSVRSGVSTPS